MIDVGADRLAAMLRACLCIRSQGDVCCTRDLLFFHIDSVWYRNDRLIHRTVYFTACGCH